MPEANGATDDANEPVKPGSDDAANVESQQQQQSAEGANGSALDAETVLAGLDADNREWLVKQGYELTPEGVGKMAKQVYAQDKLLGNAIRIPGKDATPEEKEAYLKKLGRPDTKDGYEFAVPKELPETLPYDGDRAGEFKDLAHNLGLTASQAAGIHDWFVGKAVDDHQKVGSATQEQQAAKAKTATDQLVKLWGPLDGETAQANLSMADRTLEELGGAEVKKELQEFGLLGEDKTVYSPALAQLFANIGMALYKEDTMVKGDPSRVGNPFADGESHNETTQMRIAKEDPERAVSLIRAAGKKPEDFGLTAAR